MVLYKECKGWSSQNSQLPKSAKHEHPLKVALTSTSVLVNWQQLKVWCWIFRERFPLTFKQGYLSFEVWCTSATWILILFFAISSLYSIAFHNASSDLQNNLILPDNMHLIISSPRHNWFLCETFCQLYIMYLRTYLFYFLFFILYWCQ